MKINHSGQQIQVKILRSSKRAGLPELSQVILISKKGKQGMSLRVAGIQLERSRTSESTHLEERLSRHLRVIDASAKVSRAPVDLFVFPEISLTKHYALVHGYKKHRDFMEEAKEVFLEKAGQLNSHIGFSAVWSEDKMPDVYYYIATPSGRILEYKKNDRALLSGSIREHLIIKNRKISILICNEVLSEEEYLRSLGVSEADLLVIPASVLQVWDFKLPPVEVMVVNHGESIYAGSIYFSPAHSRMISLQKGPGIMMVDF